MNQDPNMMNQSQNMVNGQTIMNGMNQGVETVPVQVNPVMDQQQQPVQMDKDQLTRTQVLNINDVEQTAQQERHNTNIKKLGFFVLAIAVILITGGVSYQMLGIGVPEKATPATTPSTEPTSSPNAIDTTPTGPYCRLDIPQDADGTDKVFTYTINEFDSFKGNYFNLMPYKIENGKISFIIAFNKDDTNLFFYFYNFNLNEGINEPKEILFEDMNIKNKFLFHFYYLFSLFNK